jgi:hypothetical protein
MIFSDVSPLAYLGTPAIDIKEIFLCFGKLHGTLAVAHATRKNHSILEVFSVTPTTIQFDYLVSHR